MEALFLLCAVVGGTILVFQFVVTLLGMGDHELGVDGFDDGHFGGAHGADAGHASHAGDSASGADHHAMDHDASNLFKMVSFRSMAAAAAFFGVAGKAATAAGLDPFTSLGIALLAGAAALYFVGWLFQSINRMAEEGNLRIERAVGLPATVYVPIPGGKSGAGKIQLKLQNRIVELRAVTSEPEKLPTGASVVVVDVVNSNTVEVEPAREPAAT